MVEELDLEQIDEKGLNARLQALTNGGHKVILCNARARHNIAVNLNGQLDITVRGSAGFYCCGFMSGPTVTVTRDVGWYAADNMLDGKLTVLNNAGSNLAPWMIGGTVIVRGSAGSRAGYGLKGGTIVVCGEVGMLAGQQMLGGRIVLLGRPGEQTGESMYGGAIFYRRGVAMSVGSNARARPLETVEVESLAVLFTENEIQADPNEFECLVPKASRQKIQAFTPPLGDRDEAVSASSADTKQAAFRQAQEAA